MRILAFDPGDEHTGWAYLVDGKRLDCGVTNLEGVRSVIFSHPIDVIVYEAWKLYPWKAKEANWSDFLAVQVIGVIKEAGRTIGIPLVVQGASVKKTMPNSILRRCGLYDVHGVEPKLKVHVRDATRHAAQFYVKWRKANGPS